MKGKGKQLTLQEKYEQMERMKKQQQEKQKAKLEQERQQRVKKQQEREQQRSQSTRTDRSEQRRVTSTQRDIYNTFGNMSYSQTENPTDYNYLNSYKDQPSQSYQVNPDYQQYSAFNQSFYSPYQSMGIPYQQPMNYQMSYDVSQNQYSSYNTFDQNVYTNYNPNNNQQLQYNHDQSMSSEYSMNYSGYNAFNQNEYSHYQSYPQQQSTSYDTSYYDPPSYQHQQHTQSSNQSNQNNQINKSNQNNKNNPNYINEYYDSTQYDYHQKRNEKERIEKERLERQDRLERIKQMEERERERKEKQEKQEKEQREKEKREQERREWKERQEMLDRDRREKKEKMEALYRERNAKKTESERKKLEEEKQALLELKQRNMQNSFLKEQHNRKRMKDQPEEYSTYIPFDISQQMKQKQEETERESVIVKTQKEDMKQNEKLKRTEYIRKFVQEKETEQTIKRNRQREIDKQRELMEQQKVKENDKSSSSTERKTSTYSAYVPYTSYQPIQSTQTMQQETNDEFNGSIDLDEDSSNEFDICEDTSQIPTLQTSPSTSSSLFDSTKVGKKLHKKQQEKEKKEQKENSDKSDKNEQLSEKEKRQKRMEKTASLRPNENDNMSEDDGYNIRDENDNLIGTSTELEKHYFRVKGIPKSSDVRPLDILKKSLQYVLDKYHSNNDYHYICDQLKSIRQDLTLQHIENEFSIEVYEIHSTISLENEDVSEFIQCASALKMLYTKFHYPIDHERNVFYIAATMLCNIDSKNVPPVISYSMIRNIPQCLLSHDYIQFVLNVKKTYDNGEYHIYLQQYRNAPHQFKIIMKIVLDKVRLKLATMLFIPMRVHIEKRLFMEYLDFESVDECDAFIQKYSILCDEKGNVLCEKSLENMRAKPQ